MRGTKINRHNNVTEAPMMEIMVPENVLSVSLNHIERLNTMP